MFQSGDVDCYKYQGRTAKDIPVPLQDRIYSSYPILLSRQRRGLAAILAVVNLKKIPTIYRFMYAKWCSNIPIFADGMSGEKGEEKPHKPWNTRRCAVLLAERGYHRGFTAPDSASLRRTLALPAAEQSLPLSLHKKQTALLGGLFLAEREGFEPSVGY